MTNWSMSTADELPIEPCDGSNVEHTVLGGGLGDIGFEADNVDNEATACRCFVSPDSFEPVESRKCTCHKVCHCAIAELEVSCTAAVALEYSVDSEPTECCVNAA